MSAINYKKHTIVISYNIKQSPIYRLTDPTKLTLSNNSLKKKKKRLLTKLFMFSYKNTGNNL